MGVVGLLAEYVKLPALRLEWPPLRELLLLQQRVLPLQLPPSRQYLLPRPTLPLPLFQVLPREIILVY
jgi:hypothetical protein